MRLRFLQLKHINHELSLLLPTVDLRSTHALSLGSLLSKMAALLFYDVKVAFLHAVLNASTRRSLDQAPPEIKMDPLESLTGIITFSRAVMVSVSNKYMETCFLTYVLH